MSTAGKVERIGKASQRVKATLVGAYYLLTLTACAFIFFFRSGQVFVVHFVTSVFFIAITAFFYGLSKAEKKPEGD